MIGKAPKNLPYRQYTDYNPNQTVKDLGDLLKHRNPFAQTSHSAMKDLDKECPRLFFFKNIVGLSPPQNKAATVGVEVHKQGENYLKGGPRPMHKSLVMALEQKLIPVPGKTVLAEELFWHATGVPSKKSPDGQVWMKGKIDCIEVVPEEITITDHKSKKDKASCTDKYTLTADDLQKDEQQSIYSHVANVMWPGRRLKVGHLYLSRDEQDPFAKLVQTPLTQEQARHTYLKVLNVVEKGVEYSQCGDWQAIPGNFGKCDRMYGRPCDFRNICHPTQDIHDLMGLVSDAAEEEPVVSPMANDPVQVLPPDVSPPVAEETEEEKKPKKTKKQKESTTMSGTDLDSLLDSALGVVPPKKKEEPKPAAATTAVAAAPTTTAAPVTKTEESKNADGNNNPDDFEALMKSAVTKPAYKAPVTAVAATTAPEKPVKEQRADVAAVIGGAVLVTETKEVLVEQLPASAVMLSSSSSTPKADPQPATTTPQKTGDRKPVRLLVMRGSMLTTDFVSASVLIPKVDAKVCESHNANEKNTKIQTMYQIEFGNWRGPFINILKKLVTEMGKEKPIVVCCHGESQVMDVVREALFPLSEEQVA